MDKKDFVEKAVVKRERRSSNEANFLIELLDRKTKKIAGAYCFAHRQSDLKGIQVGKTHKLLLKLCTFKTTENPKLEKSFADLSERPMHYNSYVIKGQIISLLEYPRPDIKWAVVDCGINVYVEVPKNAYKVGDYITAEGRLDCFLPENED